MRDKIIILLIVSLFSCTKEDNSCKYELSIFASDTSLYISYDFNGEFYKFFQTESDGTATFNPIEYNIEKELRYYPRDIIFDRQLDDDDYYNYMHPAAYITFWNSLLLDKITEVEFLHFYYSTQLSSELKKNYNYNYVHPPIKPSLKDSVLMDGVCLNINEVVMRTLGYDPILIQNFFAVNSHFEISFIESICNDQYIVKGSFSTRTIYNQDTLNIENGRFVFVTK